jgi:hypothetical protein
MKMYELNGDKRPTRPVVVNSVNRLLLQKFRLTGFDQTGQNTLKLEINGTGTGLVQLNIKYSIHGAQKPVANQSAFMLSLKSTKGPSCKAASVHVNTRLAKAVFTQHTRLPS